MNNVSWFLYFAQIVPSLGTLLEVFGVCIGVGAPIGAVAVFIRNEESSVQYQIAPVRLGRWFSVAAALITLGAMTPSRDTMYAIAASQVGEKFLQTEIASDATKALHAWIKSQINN